MQATRKGELRCKAVTWSKDPSLQLSCVPLQLVSVLIHAAKEVCAAVHIEHDPRTLLFSALTLFPVAAHLDPVGLESSVVSPPFPPVLASDLFDTVWTQLCGKSRSSLFNGSFGNSQLLNVDPGGRWDPLCREALNLFDSVMGGVYQKLANEIQCDVVGNVRRGLLLAFFAIEILSLSAVKVVLEQEYQHGQARS